MRFLSLASLLGLCFCSSLASSGCALPRDHDFSSLAVEAPVSFAEPTLPTVAPPDRWWHAFADTTLDSHIEATLAANFDLRSAWDRLRRAEAEARIQGASGRLTADLGAGASLVRNVDRDQSAGAALLSKSDRTDDRYFTNLTLGYEVDLWGRIAATRRGAVLRFEASREDAEATALLLTGSVTESWFSLLEQAALIALIEDQIATSEQFVELTELRFSLGEGSALDVLQQRGLVASNRSGLPAARSALTAASYQLDVLAGRAPDPAAIGEETLPPLPPLPALPLLPTPAELIAERPDLRAALLRLEAADEDLAIAVADRLPRLSFSLSYELSAGDLGDLFTNEVGSVIGNLVGPLLDGGRRKGEVARREALLQELLNGFSQSVLDVWFEVEELIARDRYQLELIERLEEELALSEQQVSESRSRYANGLDSYLSVLTSLQRSQTLERRLISERRRALSNRAALYRALGGRGWTPTLVPIAPHDLDRDPEPEESPR